jgi:TonB-linked SusC/RagA family outer membrane protein
MNNNRIKKYTLLLMVLAIFPHSFSIGQPNTSPAVDSLNVSNAEELISIDILPPKFTAEVDLGYNQFTSVQTTTGSVDVVTTKELENNSVINPGESLFGLLSGLTVLQNGGTAWDRSPTMFIRGRATFNSSDILVLVNGFERDMESLSMSEIESITLLKDGPALAVYGQRGANGVILVTTKRGSYESFKVDVAFDQGVNSIFRSPSFLNGNEYAMAMNEAALLDGTSPVYSPWEMERFSNGSSPLFYPNVNWWDESFKDYGTSANFSSTFSGGGKTSKYFVALNYQQENGLFDNTDIDDRYTSDLNYDKFNFRTNLDIDLTSSTLLQVNLGGVLDNRSWPGVNVNDRIMDALYSVPSGVFPVSTANDVWGGSEFYDNNPVALISSTGNRVSHRRELNANARLYQDLGSFIPGLSAEVALAYDNLAIYNEGRTRGFFYERNTLVYDEDLQAVTDTVTSQYGSDTDLSFYDNFGGQRRHSTAWGRLNYERGLNNGVLNTSLQYSQDQRVNDGQYNTFLRQNVVAQASYIHAEKYIFDGALSYSGSSILPEGQRFGLFPAVSAGWIISRENFLNNSNSVNFLKARASWGMSGNDIMEPNLFDQLYFSGGNYFFTNNNNSFPGVREGRIASQDLTFEKSRKINFGIDAVLFGNLEWMIDLFHERRSNILTATDGFFPQYLGVARPFENVGIVENQGIETSLHWSKKSGNFRYHLGGNFAFARNTIIEMSEEFKPFEYLNQTGNPVGQQFGLESVGFFSDETDIASSPAQLFSVVRPGDIKYKDQNGDGIIDQLDIVPIGYAAGYPEIYFSFTLGLEYKGVGVDALFQGIANQTLYLNTKSVFWPLRGQTSISTFNENRWTPDNADNAEFPRLSLLENANNYQKNDTWLTSGDYLKLRRLDLYFDIPEASANRLRIANARIFVRGMNLFSIDSINIVDPEETGITYPTLTSFHAGINVGF